MSAHLSLQNRATGHMFPVLGWQLCQVLVASLPHPPCPQTGSGLGHHGLSCRLYDPFLDTQGSFCSTPEPPSVAVAPALVSTEPELPLSLHPKSVTSANAQPCPQPWVCHSQAPAFVWVSSQPPSSALFLHIRAAMVSQAQGSAVTARTGSVASRGSWAVGQIKGKAGTPLGAQQALLGLGAHGHPGASKEAEATESGQAGQAYPRSLAHTYTRMYCLQCHNLHTSTVIFTNVDTDTFTHIHPIWAHALTHTPHLHPDTNTPTLTPTDPHIHSHTRVPRD